MPFLHSGQPMSKPHSTPGFSRHSDIDGNVLQGVFPSSGGFPRPRDEGLFITALGSTLGVLGLVFTLTSVGFSFSLVVIIGCFSP